VRPRSPPDSGRAKARSEPRQAPKEARPPLPCRPAPAAQVHASPPSGLRMAAHGEPEKGTGTGAVARRRRRAPSWAAGRKAPCRQPTACPADDQCRPVADARTDETAVSSNHVPSSQSRLRLHAVPGNAVPRNAAARNVAADSSHTAALSAPRHPRAHPRAPFPCAAHEPGAPTLRSSLHTRGNRDPAPTPAPGGRLGGRARAPRAQTAYGSIRCGQYCVDAAPDCLRS